MQKQNRFVMVLGLIALLAFSFCSTKKEEPVAAQSGSYSDLLSLFKEWYEFQPPKINNGVPDYTAAAMEEQRQGLEKFKNRLAAIDHSSWSISQKIDYLLVRAEMNGLDFEHRVLKPWSRDPGFYITTPLGFGPIMYGSVSIPRKLPLAEDKIAEFRMKLQAVPKIIVQAKGNLTEIAGDLALLAARAKAKEATIFDNLSKRLTEHHPDLVPDAEKARDACRDFRQWLEENKGKWTAPAGVGKENYNWYLKNVKLFPYTWDEVMAIGKREHERMICFLKLEEQRNRELPQLELAANEEEYRRRVLEAQEYLLGWLREQEIYTVPEYLKPQDPGPGSYDRPGGMRDFFQNCTDRDPLPMQNHSFLGHGPDHERHIRDTRPIRGVPNVFNQHRLYFIDGIRAEALSTGQEEMWMHAGLLDKRPRAREIAYIQLINRTARVIADLKMHSNEFTLMDAINFYVGEMPRGWMPKEESELAWFDMELYLRQPAYGMGYYMGAVQLEKLLADRAQQLGEKFILREFMDEFYAAGMIPISLTRWEMTGLDDEIKKLW